MGFKLIKSKWHWLNIIVFQARILRADRVYKSVDDPEHKAKLNETIQQLKQRRSKHITKFYEKS